MIRFKQLWDWYDRIEGTRTEWIFSLAFVFVGSVVVMTVESLVG